MYTILQLTLAAIKMFVRNKQALFFTLFMPFAIMLLFGYIGFDKPTTIKVGVVTHSPGPLAAGVASQIKEFPAFEVHEGTLEDEQAKLAQGDRAVVLDIPDTLPQQPIVAYTNEGKSGEARAVASVLDQVAARGGLAAAHAQPLFAIETRIVDAHNLRYIEFLLPGLIALSIMQMSVFSVGFVFAQYKEKGVLKRILATPMKPWEFVFANVVTRLAVAIIQTTIFILMGIILFKVHLLGSSLVLALCIELGALMFLGLGFTISGLSKSVDSVPAIANLIVFPMFFLGGTFFGIENMPGWLQAIAKVLPLTFFSTSLRDIMTKGAGFADVWPDMLAMLAWALVLVVLAALTFRFQERESA